MSLNKFAFVCKECNKITQFADIDKGCSCGNHLFVVAWSAGIPDTFDPSTYGPNYNPYRRKKRPGDSQGDKLTMPGNEDAEGESGTGFGTNVRSKGDPRADGDTSMHGDEYAEQVKNDIEDMENTISFDGEYPSGRKTEDGVQHSDGSDTRFTDPEDSLGYININKEQDPVGPHNMQKGYTPKRRHFNRLTDDVFEEILRQERI